MSTVTATAPVVVTARNLWHRSMLDESRPVYTYTGRKLFEYRGVALYRNVAGSIDYVFAGATITQRGGWSRDTVEAIIDELLAGSEMSSETVREHIRANLARGDFTKGRAA